MFYFRPENISKNLLIRAVVMGVMLATLYQLKLLTEDKSSGAMATRLSTLPVMDLSNAAELDLPY